MTVTIECGELYWQFTDANFAHCDRTDYSLFKRLRLFIKDAEQMSVDIVRAHIIEPKDNDAGKFAPACRKQFAKIKIVRKQDAVFSARFFEYFAIG